MDHLIALRKLQLETLDILEVFKAYCCEHNLTWFLLSGTALGAMRHDGFIPWDDDLDVGMPRSDYQRLLELAAQGFPDGYRLDVPGVEPTLAPMFAKMCKTGTHFVTQETVEAGYDQGIFIDIIPLDKVARDQKRRNKQLFNSFVWQSLSYLWHAKTIVVPHDGLLGAIEKAGCRVVHYAVHALLPKERILNRFTDSIIDDPELLAEEWTLLSWPRTKPFPTDVLLPTTAHVFEGTSMPMPAEPERYLELMYGDWRQLPPVDKRHTHMPLKLVFSDGEEWHA